MNNLKIRLDQLVLEQGLVISRSQAENQIKLGNVLVNDVVVKRAGTLVWPDAQITLTATEQYVSRAGLKLASVAETLNIDFKDKTVLDVGSSTGGFTDYALRHGARKVIAVELGSNQLHLSLHGDPRIELHEQTDIRNFSTKETIDVVVADVSFVSLRDILPSVAKLCNARTQIIAMVKPQFEAKQSNLTHRGVIKNEKVRREILKDYESWARNKFVILDKSDSDIAGAKGNRERFYVLKVSK
ncbi:MAG: rRNA (cytidine1920-2-O)/16S rRNA (cytidine1409-2-O)-methyltransferase [Patescibacteria group bacterium]|nr:rRNA (cytidine1920-2-O)/16S rRNA (cytidine1409-2-O)-methyltransferase [Patescibacteria group bacterium]